MSSRREFLKQSGSAALALPFVSLLPVPPVKPSCIVIGAGLSGLAAARTLGIKGWNVTILEARERTGGRVFSHRMKENNSLVCELGAEWVGASHERLLAHCKEFGLELSDHRFANTLLRNGKIERPGTWHYTPEAERAFATFRAEYKKYTRRDKERLDKFDWWTWLERIGFSEDDLRLRDLFDSTDFGESIRHVSAYMAATEYFESSPDNEMDFKIVGGNSRLIEEFVKRSTASIHTGIVVEEIRQRRGRVRVRAGGEEFEADACICTVPAKALRSIRFDPPLPTAQAEAVGQLQYARIIKSSVLYSERFWHDENFSLTSDETSHFYFHSTKNQSGDEGILTSYAVGEKADVLASQDDARRLDMVTRDLIPVDGRAPSLARGIVSYAWQRDRYTGGAYALYRPYQWFALRPLLAKPHGKILFAGEHLAEWQGFMEGAIVTGEDAAKGLLD